MQIFLNQYVIIQHKQHKFMRTNVRSIFAILLIAGVTFVACQNSKPKEIPFIYTDNGVGYRFYNQDTTARTPGEGDILSLKLTYGSPDSVYFDSNSSPEGTMLLPMYKSQFPGDLYEGLTMMHLGDSASFMIPAESFFLKTAGFPEVPDFAAGVEKLLFNVKLDKIQTQDEMEAEMIEQMAVAQGEEETKIKEYLTANNITVEPTESGMYYIETVKGTGPKPQSGEKVKVHYTGTLLDGHKFDSSVDRGQPFEFTLGVGQVIRGWDEGIAMMNVGSKGKFVLPSTMAYGERGAGRDIPPYAPLVFEVELLEIVK
ncbi:MAG: FKBP-type peptidyl-prolyl cis-trans isomerase [Sphingobacteriia bacterium]|nr:FKBP-type peptidyl-prolyl cis-trans isomerase [Sphingobacteriia bacterium]